MKMRFDDQHIDRNKKARFKNEERFDHLDNPQINKKKAYRMGYTDADRLIKKYGVKVLDFDDFDWAA